MAKKNEHYYVYFSTSGYIYRVGFLAFKNKSEIKSDYYKGLKYYSTKERAQKIADKYNEKIKDVDEFKFARLVNEFSSKIWEIEQNEGIKDHYAKDAIESLRLMMQTCQKLVVDTVKLEKYTNKSKV